MKKLIEQGLDDHPAGDGDKVPSAWSLAVLDDCAGCDDLRIELTVEEVGRSGYGQVAHLSPGRADCERLSPALFAKSVKAPDPTGQWEKWRRTARCFLYFRNMKICRFRPDYRRRVEVSVVPSG